MLGHRFRADTYDLVLQNCNHFSDELVYAISKGQARLPPYLSRFSRIAAYFLCCIPLAVRQANPVRDGDSCKSKMSKIHVVGNESCCVTYLGQACHHDCNSDDDEALHAMRAPCSHIHCEHVLLRRQRSEGHGSSSSNSWMRADS